MTTRRKLVRRSFLAAVAGASGLTLAACSGQGNSSDPSGNNSASSAREAEPSDSDAS